MKFVAQKISNSKGAVALVPYDTTGDEYLRAIKDGKYVTVEVKKPRNPLHHAKLFALLQKVCDNQERYKTLDALLVAIKIAVGRYTEYPMKDGAVVLVPESISFESLGQDEFNVFYDRALDVIAKDFLPGIDKEELRAEVEAFLAQRAA